MRKRGAIEIQFNWIFILIAGVVILGFFVSIINKQRVIAEDQITTSIKVNLGAVLTGARAASSTATRISIPDIDIFYDCDGYTVGKADAIRTKTSFSPSVIRGPVIMSWNQEWYMPFRVDNFLYITTPFVRYVFVKDPHGVIERLYHDMPNRTIRDKGEIKAFFTKELVDADDINGLVDLNHYKVKFIFAGNPNSPIPNPMSQVLPSLGSVKRRDFTGVLIGATSYEQLNGNGPLVFYEKGTVNFKETGRTHYLGRASAIGAVFAENEDTFNCNMHRALNTLEIVNKIYEGRGDFLLASFDPSDICKTPYQQAKNYFSSINVAVQSAYPNNINSISNAATSLDMQNERALQNSCPPIY